MEKAQQVDTALGITDKVKKVDESLGVSKKAKELDTALGVTDLVQKVDQNLGVSKGIQEIQDTFQGKSARFQDRLEGFSFETKDGVTVVTKSAGEVDYTGQQVMSINGAPIKGLSNDDVLNLIKSEKLPLTVVFEKCAEEGEKN
eukprot:UN30220